MALEGKLKVLEGFVRDKMIALPQDKPYVIGRERECDMAVMSRRVSRRHAEITFRNGAFGIKDLESKTGTLVNNAKVAGTVLRSGDVVQVGDIKFKFLFEESAPAQPVLPKPAVSLPKPVVSPPKPATAMGVAKPAAPAPKPATAMGIPRPAPATPAPKPEVPAELPQTEPMPVEEPTPAPPPAAEAPKAAAPAPAPKPRAVPPPEVPADLPQTEPMAAEETEAAPPVVETPVEAPATEVAVVPDDASDLDVVDESEPTTSEDVPAIEEDATELREMTPPPPFTDTELALIGRMIGGVKIIATLGRGRRTVVYKGTQASHNRVVALRMLTAEAARDPEIVRWFITGAKNAGELRHEDIVTPLGGGRENGVFFVYTKFMENRCAKDVFARAVAGNVPLVKRALESLVHVVRALEYGQSRNILHLGIRPSKLLYDELWHAKLNGLAFDNTLSAPGARPTPEIQAYLAPEQITGGGPVTIVTDLCALGATFYYLLTGRRPERDRKQRIPSPKDANKVVPDSLCRIVEKMSDPDPNARYRSYGQLLHDLRWALRGEAWPHPIK
jgi:hypothetical protein